jgi:hypothetical protein
MQRRGVERAGLLMILIACGAFGATQAGARGAHRHGGGDLSAAASPYAILAPITLSHAPVGEGRAALEGDWPGGLSSCPPGRSAAPAPDGDTWRCR